MRLLVGMLNVMALVRTVDDIAVLCDSCQYQGFPSSKDTIFAGSVTGIRLLPVTRITCGCYSLLRKVEV